MQSLCRLLWSRGVRACTTAPTVVEWGEAGLLLAAFALIAVPVGQARGWLTFSPSRDSLGFLVLFAVTAFIVPSWVEEMIFRAALLPHPSEKPSRRTLILHV